MIIKINNKTENLIMDLESIFNMPVQNGEGLTLLTLKESEQFVGFVDYLHQLKDQNFLLVAWLQAVYWISKVTL